MGRTQLEYVLWAQNCVYLKSKYKYLTRNKPIVAKCWWKFVPQIISTSVTTLFWSGDNIIQAFNIFDIMFPFLVSIGFV